MALCDFDVDPNHPLFKEITDRFQIFRNRLNNIPPLRRYNPRLDSVTRSVKSAQLEAALQGCLDEIKAAINTKCKRILCSKPPISHSWNDITTNSILAENMKLIHTLSITKHNPTLTLKLKERITKNYTRINKLVTKQKLVNWKICTEKIRVEKTHVDYSSYSSRHPPAIPDSCDDSEWESSSDEYAILSNAQVPVSPHSRKRQFNACSISAVSMSKCPRGDRKSTRLLCSSPGQPQAPEASSRSGTQREPPPIQK